MSLYMLVLIAHSWLRWAVLLAGLWACARALSGWNGQREWNATDRKSMLAYVSALDLQLLLGLVLYFVLSPITPSSMQQFGANMKVSALRFYSVEHVFGMVLALVVAHVTSVRIKRAPDSRSRFRRQMLGVVVSLLMVLAAIPWPGLEWGRPLFRLP